MRVCAIGVNHDKTPLDIRERLAINADQLSETLASLSDRLPQSVLLSTCNRTEIYTIDRGDTANRDAVVAFMSARAEVPESDLLPHLYIHEGSAAVKHLFRVASGLDSLIIGEYEILGQVRQALENGNKGGKVGLPLLNLFRHSIRTGRRVRDETRLSRNALSVSSVAVDLATKAVGDLGDCRILVIGAGEAGKLVAKAALSRRASHITVTSRSIERAAALSDVLGGKAVAFSELGGALSDADVVITCTGAPDTIVDRQIIEHAMSTRPERHLAIVDIAVPRDVEPEVRHTKNVSLYDIDDFTQIARMNEQLRRTEIANAMEIVEAEVDRYVVWFEALKVKPTISALAQKAEAIRQAQLNLTLKKLNNLSDEERESLESMTRAIVKKVLHDPVQCLKRNCHQCARHDCSSNDVHIQVINEIFRLGSEASA